MPTLTKIDLYEGDTALGKAEIYCEFDGINPGKINLRVENHVITEEGGLSDLTDFSYHMGKVICVLQGLNADEAMSIREYQNSKGQPLLTILYDSFKINNRTSPVPKIIGQNKFDEIKNKKFPSMNSSYLSKLSSVLYDELTL